MSQEVFFQIFWNNLCRIGITSSLNLWQNLPGSSMGLEFSFCWKLWITNIISLYIKNSLGLFVSSWLSFGLSWRSNVTCSLYLSCWIYWHKIIQNMPFLFFNMWHFVVMLPLLIFDIGNYIFTFFSTICLEV